MIACRFAICIVVAMIAAGGSPCWAQPAIAPPSSQPAIATQVTPDAQALSLLASRMRDAIEFSPLSRRTAISVQVIDATSGAVLYERFPEYLMVPASIMKLYTSVAALAAWGADHRFTTEVRSSVAPSNGLIAGDIYLVGGGDPTLSSSDLRALARRMRSELGITRISGGVHVDASRFANTLKGPGWMWDDDPDPYQMSVTALMVDYNVLTVSVGSGTSVDSPAAVRYEPPSDWPPVMNEATTAQQGRNLRITREPFDDLIRVAGSATIGGQAVRRQLTMHDPRPWIRGMFVAMLQAEGIDVGRPTAAPAALRAPGASTLVLSHQGKPLGEILGLFNKPSENAIGEVLLLNLAHRSTSAPGTWQAGQNTMNSFLTETAGLTGSTFRVADGSGLSRYNLVNAAGTVRLLQYAFQRPDRDVLLRALPSGGEGTLGERMRQLRIHAKTGTMSGVTCLAGYIQASDGSWRIFAIHMNGFVGSSNPLRALQDELCRIIAQTP